MRESRSYGGGVRLGDERVFRRVVLAFHGAFARDFPWRNSTNPYEVLVGEVLLQRTSGSHVSAIYDDFLRRWPTPECLARARVSSIMSMIRPLGLAKRAPLLKRLGAAIVEAGGVPREPEQLAQLPGVGAYAARAVPVFASGRDLPLVDWVIARVLRRYFGMPSLRRPNADRELWSLAEGLARKGRARDLWLGTLDLAADVCKPRPNCPECPLVRSCDFFASGGYESRADRRRITSV
jgi:A/G-specific adenine glycosylase